MPFLFLPSNVQNHQCITKHDQIHHLHPINSELATFARRLSGRCGFTFQSAGEEVPLFNLVTKDTP